MFSDKIKNTIENKNVFNWFSFSVEFSKKWQIESKLLIKSEVLFDIWRKKINYIIVITES